MNFNLPKVLVAFFFLLTLVVAGLLGGYFYLRSRIMPNYVVEDASSKGVPAFRILSNDFSIDLSEVNFYIGRTGDVTLVSRQEVEPGIIEYVFSKSIADSQNYFRAQFAYDYPDSGGWSENNWLMNYDVNFGEPGSVVTVAMVGVNEYKLSKDEGGGDWPEAYRKVYANLEPNTRERVIEYFQTGKIDPSWTKGEDGVLDLRKVLAVKRIEANE